MRISNWLGGAMLGAVVLTTAARGATMAGQVQPVPLGGSLAGLRGDRSFGVYIPTRFGGELSVAASSGTVSEITGPDGKRVAGGAEIGHDRHGWHTFTVTGADGPYTIRTRFVQVGRSARKPWNFYYWPTKGDAIHEPWAGGNGRVDTLYVNGDDLLVATPGGYIPPGQDIVRPGANGILETRPAPGDTSTWFPNEYDDLTFVGPDGALYATPAPMLKYDQLFGTSARSWEAANSQNQDIQRWPGHCLGGAVASIMLNEPAPAPGTGVTADELKALWAELGENHYNHRIGDHATDIPPGPPRPGWDECDSHAARVHSMLERHIRGQRKALLCNLRAFPPRGTPHEVWNHGVGKYTATYHAVPGKGERSVRLEVDLEANTGSMLNGNDDKPRRIRYEYVVVYGLNGEVDQLNVYNNDWIAVGEEAMFAPLNVLEVAESRWQGHNPMITLENVRALDVANGGGSRFAAGSPPQFRPVASYEAGRAGMFGLGGGGGLFGGGPAMPPPNSMYDASSPGRAGFFGFLRGR